MYHTAKFKAKEVKFDMVISPTMINYYKHSTNSSKEYVFSPLEEFIVCHIKWL